MEDAELAYAMTRYREIHDFLHVLTGLPPTVEGELALKTLEAVLELSLVCHPVLAWLG